MAEEPRYLAPFRQRDFQISCAAVTFALTLLLMCLFAALVLRSRGDDDDDNEGSFVERIPTTPTAFMIPTSVALAGTPTPTPFQAALATLAPTPTALILIPGSGFIPGGFPTAVPIPFNPGIPAGPPPGQPPPVIIPTNPPPPTQPPPPTNTPVEGYQIVIETQGSESLYLVNRTPGKNLALAPLVLGDGDGAISGSEWEKDTLGPGQCVTAWKEGDAEEPDVDCATVGRKIKRSGSERFWGDDFNVYYNGALVGQCDKDKCSFRIPD